MDRKFPVTLPEGYIDFYKSLETWQNEQEIKLKKNPQPEKIDISKILASSKPVINTLKPQIDTQQFKTMYNELLALIKDQRKDIADKIDQISARVEELDFDEVTRKLVNNDQHYLVELAARLEVPAELFMFSLDHAYRPFIRVLASSYYEDIANDELRSWQLSGICPFCGSKAHFSRLRAADGCRFMFCDRCFTEWESRYLYCVHCGNDEPGTINYISIENDSAYQIYTCDKCKGYLKTYDEREAGGNTTDLFIANMETIYLDMLAQERGYHTHDNYQD